MATALQDDKLKYDSTVHARAYQLDMYNESLKQNIIVAMDTGSGKTLVAVERIRTELLRSSAAQIIWFMCPGVALTHQQAEALQRGLGEAYIVKTLTGNDNVDTWTAKEPWDAALLNVNVVVCTYQVLLHALRHGFVNISSIPLLVFDEAHHCNRDHAANRIMQEFYHESRKADAKAALPIILGLSASPVTSKSSGGLSKIEQNLDSISKTPRTHRQELLKFVNRPVMSVVSYPKFDIPESSPSSTLLAYHKHMRISEDPYIKTLTETESPLLEQTVLNRKTYTQKHMNGFVKAAQLVESELGIWATQYFISKCVEQFVESQDSFVWLEGEDSDKAYLKDILIALGSTTPDTNLLHSDLSMSPKLSVLVEVLHNEMQISNTSGIVFVETRAQVHMLSVLLRSLPKTKDLVRSITLVGASQNHQRKGQLRELADAGNHESAIDELRSGRMNLIISTSACEEGIDISACNLVICFQPPPNLRSFVQRRGRARAMTSKYILMAQLDDPRGNRSSEWQKLEKEMEADYMNEKRKLAQLEQVESQDEGYRELIVQKTGAKITLHSSVQHLYHFVQKLPHVSYTVLAPTLMFQKQTIENVAWFSCQLELPNSVDPSLRSWNSTEMWRSEKMARRDVCFEAYVSLRSAGLINDSLLPEPQLDSEAEKAYAEVVKGPNLAKVEVQLNPWTSVAHLWASLDGHVWQSILSLKTSGGSILQMILVTPCPLPPLPDLILYIDGTTTITLSFDKSTATTVNASYLNDANTATSVLLRSIFRTRMSTAEVGFPALFVPRSIKDFPSWVASVATEFSATELINLRAAESEEVGIVRHKNGRRFIFRGIEMRVPVSEGGVDSMEPIPHLKCKDFPKRLDFFHPAQNTTSTALNFEYLQPEDCLADTLPLKYANFARIIPSLLHFVGQHLLVEKLRHGLLRPVDLVTPELLLTAISAPSAFQGRDYERLEFLGDTILKMMTSVTVMANHPKWHEGYLSHQKDRIVSNGRLAIAAEKVGLTKFIATKQFSAHKWRPLRNKILVAEADSVSFRDLSTKTMADVVEAIIGAAFLDGGFPKVLSALQIFLPEVEWQPITQLNEKLRTLSSTSSPINPASPQIVRLETLLVYNFNNKALLLEAITHPSHTTSSVPSYQRLEFLGDSILDYLVTNLIFQNKKQQPVYRMHRLRTATVNANFLSYCALSTTIDIQTNRPSTQLLSVSSKPSSNAGEGSEPKFDTTTSSLSVLSFLLKASIPDLNRALYATETRYRLVKPLLQDELDHGHQYPWRVLAAFNPEKTLSDIVEAVLGAVWIDSGGDFEVVEKVGRRIGLFTWLERALKEDVGCWHPKEEVGTFGSLGAKGLAGVQYVVWRGPDSALPPVSRDVNVNMQTLDQSMTNDGPVEDNEGMLATSIDPKKLNFGEGIYHCQIVVNGEHVCTSRGWNRLEVETAAAEQAIGILRCRQHEIPENVRESSPIKDSKTLSATTTVEDEEYDVEDDDSQDGGVLLPETSLEERSSVVSTLKRKLIS